MDHGQDWMSSETSVHFIKYLSSLELSLQKETYGTFTVMGDVIREPGLHRFWLVMAMDRRQWVVVKRPCPLKEHSAS